MLTHLLFSEALLIHLVGQAHLIMLVLVVGGIGVPPPIRIDSAAQVGVSVTPTAAVSITITSKSRTVGADSQTDAGTIESSGMQGARGYRYAVRSSAGVRTRGEARCRASARKGVAAETAVPGDTMSSSGSMATAALRFDLQGRRKNQESRNTHQAPHTLIICLICLFRVNGFSNRGLGRSSASCPSSRMVFLQLSLAGSSLPGVWR